MNILSATNALKEIKLKELDDEFQIALMNVINKAFPDTIRISCESTGDEIRKLIDTELPADARTELMQSSVFHDRNDIVRFFNNVERLQETHQRLVEFDDAVKGNFITSMAFLVIIVVVGLMTLYVLTENTRGKVPDSRVAHMAINIVDNLTKAPAPTEPQP